MNYHIKCWRNPKENFEPTIDEDCSDKKLVDWLNILIENLQAKTSEPLVQAIEVVRIEPNN